MSFRINYLPIVAVGALLCANVWAQTTHEADRPPTVIPVASEPAPKLIAYAPEPEPLARGVVIIPFRTENLRIIPVFGKGALSVSPRVGHLHVSVDDWPGGWAHTNQDPVIVNGLRPGTHQIKLEVADPTHTILTSQTVTVVVPAKQAAPVPIH
jgi:hypothetical protein